MQDKAFLDTNILIYLYAEDDKNKRDAVREVLDDYDCVTSLQAINEVSNVLFKKFSLSSAQIKEHLVNIEAVCSDVMPIHRYTIEEALDIRERYGFSYFDCLMLASALEGTCRIIFTEDMRDGQIIEKTLTITNPFK